MSITEGVGSPGDHHPFAVRGARLGPRARLRYDAPPVSESVHKRIDRAVYQAERAVVVGSLVVMAIVVFLDVVHRSFSGGDSKLAMVISKIGGWFGAELSAGTAGYARLEAAAPTMLFATFTALTYFGIRTAKRAKPVPAATALLAAVAGVLVAYGLVRLLLVALPNGLTWSQDLALVLTLWVGFVGASMCTYENRHLRVEAAQRLLPEKLRPFVGFASGLFTTLVCLGLVWLSVRYVAFHYQEYTTTEGKGGLFPGMDLPKFIGFAALPLSFAFMAVRFFAKALGALRGEIEAPLDPVEAAVGAPLQDAGPMPSQVSTEALPRDSTPDKPSTVDTMTSKAHMQAEPGAPQQLQSKVPTDTHDIIPPLSGSIGEVDDPDDPNDPDDDPDRTTEVEDGPILFAEDTRELRDSGELLSKDDDTGEGRR